MNIALAVTNNMVTEHFGHCEYFLIHEVEGKDIKGTKIVKNPPHQKGFLPDYLKKMDVDVIICGNMGEMALKMFEDLGISVYRGISGNVEEITGKYLRGELVSSEAICREHAYHHES